MGDILRRSVHGESGRPCAQAWRASMNNTSPRRSRNFPSHAPIRLRETTSTPGSGSNRKAGPGKRDHAIDEARFDQTLPDLSFSPDWLDDMEPLASTKPADTASGPSDARYAEPTRSSRCLWVGHRMLPALVLSQPLTTPILDVEGRIGQDEIRLEIRMTVVVKTVALLDAVPRFHEWPGSFLQGARSCNSTPDRRSTCRSWRPAARCLRCRCPWRGHRMNSIDCTNMPDGPATRIVDPPPIRLEHFNEQP